MRLKLSQSILIAFLFITNTFVGQNLEYLFFSSQSYDPAESSSRSSKTSEKNKAIGLKTETSIVTDANDKTKLRGVKNFNKEGQIVQYIWEYTAHKDFIIDFKYDTNNLLVQRKQFVSNNPHKYTLQTYRSDDKKRITSFEKAKYVNKTLKSYSKVTKEFIEDKMISQAYFDSKSKDPKSHYKYEFHEDGTRKETNLYTKGKLKYTWHYDCNPAGTIKQTKDTTTICTRIETSTDGSYTKYAQETNQKGEIIVKKWIFSADSIVQHYSKSYLDGSLIYEFVKTEDGRIRTNYRKGKKLTITTTKTNKKGKDISYEVVNFKHPKWSFKQEYEYDNNGLKTLQRTYDKDGKLTGTMKIMRTFYEKD